MHGGPQFTTAVFHFMLAITTYIKKIDLSDGAAKNNIPTCRIGTILKIGPRGRV